MWDNTDAAAGKTYKGKRYSDTSIGNIYFTYTTTSFYIHWSYIYIDTRVHCASVGIMYTVALIRKSLTKTLLLVIGNTSIDTCVWPGPFDSIFDVSPVRSVHVSNQWNIETSAKLWNFSSVHTVTAEGPRVSQLTAQRVCEVGIFLQVRLIRAIGAVVDDFCENLGYSKQKKIPIKFKRSQLGTIP